MNNYIFRKAILSDLPKIIEYLSLISICDWASVGNFGWEFKIQKTLK